MDRLLTNLGHESVSVFRDIAFVKYLLFHGRAENETLSIVTIMLSNELESLRSSLRLYFPQRFFND
jgi:hypothetical protein